MTNENVEKVRKVIDEDRHIEKSLKIKATTINKIFHDHLKYRNVVLRWVTYYLTEAQKVSRVDWCKFNNDQSKQVYDETLIYNYDLETESQY